VFKGVQHSWVDGEAGESVPINKALDMLKDSLVKKGEDFAHQVVGDEIDCRNRG